MLICVKQKHKYKTMLNYTQSRLSGETPVSKTGELAMFYLFIY